MKKTNYQYQPIPLSDVLDDNKFIIPHFQRNVVWKQKRKQNFINNIRAGEPFGTILIRENNGKYELIDGLQRVTTIMDFIENPFNYLDANVIPLEIAKEIIIKNLSIQQIPCNDDYLDKIAPDVQNEIYERLKGGFKNYQAMSSIRKKFGLVDSTEIDDLIDECYKIFNEEKDISSLVLNAINYTGPAENIPNVFFNLNTGGVQLSKYETYAALWSKPLFKITDKELLDVIKNKYQQLEKDSDLEVDFNEEDLINNGISLFEFCYSLSGIIREKFSLLFGNNTKSTDPIGFEILTLVLNRKVNQADKLHDLLKDCSISGDFLISLKNMIIQSLSVINKSLEKLLIGLNKTHLYSDSTYMIYHIIASYIKENYSIDIDNETITPISVGLPRKDFETYLPLHYFYDCITDYWKANRQVSDLHRDINDDSKRKKYWYAIADQDWDVGVSMFMSSQETINKTIPQKNKLFVDFLTKLKVKENMKFYTEFYTSSDVSNLDFEHIAPQKAIVTHINDMTTSQQKVYPISAVGNLCYLSVKDNRSKRDKTIYEWVDDRPSYTFDKAYLDFILYPSENEISFVKYNNLQFRIEYDKFIHNRQTEMQNEFLNLIKKYRGLL